MQVERVLKKYGDGTSTYDKYPYVRVTDQSSDCIKGWVQIKENLNATIRALDDSVKTIVIETYHGVFNDVLKQELIRHFKHDFFFDTADLFREEGEINTLLSGPLGDHPIFAYMSDFTIHDFMDGHRVDALINQIKGINEGIIVVFGVGASQVIADPSVTVYADMARWEIQQRMRAGRVANLGATNFDEAIASKYKRAYFVDWRVCDKMKKTLLPHLDFLLDLNDETVPKMISGGLLRLGLKKAAHQPFRVVPFFDPGIWGGQWMREICDLPSDPINYAWCFDCVPEENSLLLAFGEERVEIPAIDLIFNQPKSLLGNTICEQFGAEFPIRFDFLDTMDGGNLSLQVHPVKAYMKEHFGLPYTQDESYYILDAGEDAVVYLGLKEGIDSTKMLDELELAEKGEIHFEAGKYVQDWPVKKHDHFLIPAGTIHCSGKNSMVLEISATPYIFTFKLWDWGRVDLDGKPRPISLKHGRNVMQWDRTTPWVGAELVNHLEDIEQGEGYSQERTGLHETQFIETRRHWFSQTVSHHTDGNLNVLNLVEGAEVVVESPDGLFEPFTVHYAETFIMPASIGNYTIRPAGISEGKKCATLKAFVRP